MRANIVKIVVAAAILLMGIAYVSLGLRESEEQQKVLRVGYFPTINHSQALLGIEDGSFQESVGDDTELEWIQFNSGPSAMEAMFSENLDISYIGSGPAINGYNRSNGDIVILSGAMDAGAVLLVRSGEGIESVSDLSGKMVSIPQYGNTQDIVLRKLLREAGLEDRSRGGDVDIIQAGGSDTMTLLERGDISAAIVPEPWGSIIGDSEGVDILLDESELYRDGDYPTALIIARREIVDKYPEEVESFLRNHLEITNYISENKVNSVNFISKALLRLSGREIPKGIIEKSISRVRVTSEVDRDAVRDMAEILRYVGYDRGNLDIEGIFRTEILEKILKE